MGIVNVELVVKVFVVLEHTETGVKFEPLLEVGILPPTLYPGVLKVLIPSVKKTITQ